jgi:lipopolysaccharide/colanic/teichoic acid biosynthesis glycosyltransferase
MSIPLKKPVPPAGVPPHPTTGAGDRSEPERDPWPEIDRLTADAAVDLPLGPSWYGAVKVLLDYLLAVLVLPLAVLLIGLAALAIKLTSPGPVFYTQTRVGLNGRRYRIFKIRTMHHNCELSSGIRWAGKHDDRITPIGKLLRVTHIDELPQLFNVLLGDMSLVGPRPERPEVIHAKRLEQLVPGYRHRLRVKPGVTGLAQLQLPADSDITSVRYKVVYDLYYAQNQSLLLDLRILAATLAKAAGAGPRILRRAFLLPSRRRVADVFHGNLTVEPAPLAQLQPA